MEVFLTIVSKIAHETKCVPLMRWREGEKDAVFFFEFNNAANKKVLQSDTIERLEITVRP